MNKGFKLGILNCTYCNFSGFDCNEESGPHWTCLNKKTKLYKNNVIMDENTANHTRCIRYKLDKIRL